MRKIASHFLFVSLILTGAEGLTPEERQVTEGVRAEILKGHVSFLASDALEGRDTPSAGLEVAAEYIAAQFRRFGLQPAGDGGTYFQNAPFVRVTQPMEGFQLRLALPDGKAWESTGDRVMAVFAGPVREKDLPVVKVSLAEGKTELPAREAVRGKALVVVLSQRTAEVIAKRDALLAMEPAAVVMLGFTQRGPRLRPAGGKTQPPTVVTASPEFTAFAEALPEGATEAKLSLEAAGPVEEPVRLRNVIGTLPGSDPTLKEEYVLLTAHYDHTGVLTRGEGDRINNGANDDASGVATVLALAEAFSGVKTRPKRTLVFMTYFGEEKGLLGSRYYAAHPVFPLRRTSVNLNFEHMGRTDDTEGDRKGKITTTGFDYTTLGALMTAAGKDTGVETWMHEKNSDAFFGRSDNQALADAGVPAVTVCVSWIFPDYHRPGDHWEKIDFENMERAVRTVGVLAKRVGDGPGVEWVEGNGKTEKYVKAYRKLVEAGN